MRAPFANRPLAPASGIVPIRSEWNGAVAQLGERVVRNDEVRGSIPLGSTIHSFSARSNGTAGSGAFGALLERFAIIG